MVNPLERFFKTTRTGLETNDLDKTSYYEFENMIISMKD